MADQTAAEVFVERLIEWGVDTIFGLPGDGINGFMEALRKSKDRIRQDSQAYDLVGELGWVTRGHCNPRWGRSRRRPSSTSAVLDGLRKAAASG